MDAQLKRGLLEVCVLSVLAKGDSYGYRLVQEMEQCIEISESTLYPLLKRLESSGCLTVRSVEHNGRLRKYYGITNIGRSKIEEFLIDWKDIERIYEFVRGGGAA